MGFNEAGRNSPMSTQKEGGGTAASRMTRQELIARLLRSNEHSSFEFTEEWLNSQWTRRLRTLLAQQQQQQEKAPDAN